MSSVDERVMYVPPTSMGFGHNVRPGKVFLQPSFFFPYPHDSDEIHSFLQALSADLPFRFSPHHFQRVYPSKSGNGYLSRKLPKDWLRCNS